ncbi:MAG: DUF4398 domain-containing protein [Polyangiaceae bacterium]
MRLGALGLIGLAIASSGCGGVYYAVEVTSASSRLAEARELGAEKSAPYEYYYAKAHLEQAQAEASEASYSDAANLADTADEYAQKAIEISQSAKREAAAGQP